MRYILALTPPNEQSSQYIELAQKLFSSVSDCYLLSEKASPHITICQFETDDERKSVKFWKDIEQYKISSISPRLTGVSFLRGFGLLKEYTWVEISVARDPEIMQIHELALNALKKNELTSYNESGDLYRPHITLARIHMPDTLQKWPDVIFEERGKYKLTLAKGDDHGQYLQTLYEYN
jgi:2'-5' RNA ligase